MHLLIPFASCQSEACHQALASLKLPHLNQLLRQLMPLPLDRGDENTLTPPHERVLAKALGLDGGGPSSDGQLPWAAWHVAQSARSLATAAPAEPDAAWAFITPCQWAVQTNHISMGDPQTLQLSEADSRLLLAAMAPYFAEDGITLAYDAPTRWLARSELFRDLATASLDRVVGRNTDDWIPRGPEAQLLRRLQNEMQMLLYTHAVTDDRTARGLPTVNSFWVSGTGALPPGWAPASTAPATVPAVIVPTTLRDAALHEDWPAWAQAWQDIDATACVALLAALQQGSSATLTLCGERHAQRFVRSTHGPGQRFWAQIKDVLGLQRPYQLRGQL